MSEPPYWFADVDDEAEVQPYVWRPYLETRTGHIPGIDIWFDTRERCEGWIRQFVLGAPLDDQR